MGRMLDCYSPTLWAQHKPMANKAISFEMRSGSVKRVFSNRNPRPLGLETYSQFPTVADKYRLHVLHLHSWQQSLIHLF
jgi:hypothetical protein